MSAPSHGPGAEGIYPFERIDDGLPYLPLVARRVLDALGRKLSLEGWLSLSIEDRRQIAAAGTAERVDPSVAAAIDRATPAPAKLGPLPEPGAASPPTELVAALGPGRPLDGARWSGLSALGRYALVKCASKGEKLALAYDQIVAATHRVPLTHLTPAGEAHMVDVGGKVETARRAVASARVRTTRAVVEAIAGGAAGVPGVLEKGDVIAAARIAGILASKRTPELIPLCHPVRTTRAAIDFEPDAERGELTIRATVEAVDRTGVEMEAMVAAAVASLTVYDMIKSADRWATIDGVRLDAKSGGKSGDMNRPPGRAGT
jgi:cyclic pyranopterin monophosphate synthase